MTVFIARVALLQGQLLNVREKIRYAKFQHSHKDDEPSASDKRELCELETRERNIFDKIADAKRESEKEGKDDSIGVAYQCNQCGVTIEGIVLLYSSKIL